MANMKANVTGRSKGEPKHVRDYEWVLASPAYRSLSCYARSLQTELKRLYNGSNNGALYLSVRDAAALLGVNKDTAAKAFRELEGRGFVRPNRVGSFAWKKGVSTTWTLEEFPLGDEMPTKAFMRWTPPTDTAPMRDIRDRKTRSRSHYADRVSVQTDKVSHHVDTTGPKVVEVSATSDSFEQNDPKSVPLDQTYIVTRQGEPESRSAAASFHVAQPPEAIVAPKSAPADAPLAVLSFQPVGKTAANIVSRLPQRRETA